MQNWTYCVVGNIKESYIDKDGIVRYGTSAFVGGAKVYLAGRIWDRSRSDICAIGMTRGKKIQVIDTDITRIENLRCQKVFRKGILELMNDFEFRSCWWGRSKREKEDAEEFIVWWNSHVQHSEENQPNEQE